MTTPKVFLLLQILLLVFAPLAAGYSLGAPDGACESMRPGHRQVEHNVSTPLVEPQTLPVSDYYTIEPNKTENIQPGEIIEVFLKAIKPDTYYFEGFLLQARDKTDKVISDSSEKHGTFISLDAETKLLCSGKGITHAVHRHFENMTVHWRAPDTEFSDVSFKATFVKNYETIFLGVRSDVLNPGNAGFTVLPSLIIVLAGLLTTSWFMGHL